MQFVKSVSLATAVASMLLSVGCGSDDKESTDQAQGETVKCQGINECKGTSECAGAGSSCQGQNECAGHGWMSVDTEQDCTTKGGKVLSG
jgi:uncharacterized membrane protein